MSFSTCSIALWFTTGRVHPASGPTAKSGGAVHEVSDRSDQSDRAMLIFDQLRKNDPQLRVITWGVLLGMGALFVGLWYVQVISHRVAGRFRRVQAAYGAA